MAYSFTCQKSGKTFYLHEQRQQVKGGQQVTIYFFDGEVKEGALDALPSGYEVSENSSTGRPIVKKKR